MVSKELKTVLSLNKPVEAGLLAMHRPWSIPFHKRMKNVNHYDLTYNFDTVASGNHPSLAA
jgi:hypothetical protein